LNIETAGDITILTIDLDHIDALNSKILSTDLINAVSGKSKVVLDLNKVKFIDSSGLGSILTTLRHIHNNRGKIHICQVTESVKVLFKMVRLSQLVPIMNTRDEAIQALS